MWITCYNCNGSGIESYKENYYNIFEEKNKERNCSICEMYRFSVEGYDFYGQIWTEETDILTPPSSPHT